MAHKTLISGTAYDVGSGRVLIGGTGYGAQKGRTLVGGTGYDINFGTKTADLAVGTEVYMNVGGTRTAFTIVHQGNPDASIYDASCNGTWVLQKSFTVEFSPTKGHSYEGSDPDVWLTDTFIPSLDANVASAVKSVKIPWRDGGMYGSLYQGADGLERKAFLLSGVEVGFIRDGLVDPNCGRVLSYFSKCKPFEADATRVKRLDGRYEYPWGLRDPIAAQVYDMNCVGDDGSWTYYGSNYSNYGGAVPAMVLSSSTKVDDSMNIIG